MQEMQESWLGEYLDVYMTQGTVGWYLWYSLLSFCILSHHISIYVQKIPDTHQQ